MEESFSFYRKRTLVSSNPTNYACKMHQLSDLDLIMEKHYHHKIIYYYKTPMGSTLGELTATIRERLSELLSYYPVVIGRLIKNEKEKWMVKCNDAGLRIVESRVKGSVEKWLANVDDEKEKRLIHWEDPFHASYLWATFYVQMTEFEEGGLAVGLSCSHMIADPICGTMFIKGLADHTMSRGKITIPPLFHTLPQHRLGSQNSQLETNTYLIHHYKSLLESPSLSPSPLGAQKYKTVTFSFKDHMVRSCIRLAQLDGPANDAYSRVFISLVGLLWTCISRVKGSKNGLVDMSVCSNARKMLGLDQGFFGNCMIYNIVHGNGIGVDDLALSTKAIKGAMENVNKATILDLVKWLGDYNDLDPSRVIYINDLVFVNLESTDPYSAAFIEGYEPIRVSYYNEPNLGKEKVLVLPSHPCDGEFSRIVMVTLPIDEAIKLCDDEVLARYSPTVIMGSKHM